MATVASLMVKIGGDISGLTSSLAEAEKRLSSVGKSMTNAGKTLSLGLTLPIVGLGASIVKTGMEFEAQMSRVQAISGATANEMALMKNQALELGASTSKSASEVAKGFEEMAAMGFTAQEVMSAMPGVIAASEASGADMAQVSAVMASTLNAFAMEADQANHVADVLAKTANISAADITDMQYALKYAAGPAHALGVSLEELSAAVGIMVDRGATGETAGTTLRASLLRLVDPPKEAQKALDALGVSVLDGKGEFKSLSTILTDMKKGLNGLTDAQQTARLAQVFGTEAASNMLNLIEAGPQVLDDMTFALENSSGSAAEAATIMKDNLAGSFDNLTGAIETASIELYDMNSGPLRSVVDGLTQLVKAFTALPPNVQQSILLVVAALATLGPSLMFLGMMAQGVGALAGVFALLTSPVGLIIGLLAALAAGLVYLYTTNETARNIMNAAWEGLKTAAETIFNGLLAFWEQHGSTITAYFTGLWDSIKSVFEGVWGFISDLAVRIFDGLLQFWEDNGAGITQVFSTIWDTISSLLSDVAAFIDETLGYIAEQWNMVWPSLSEALGNVFNFILEYIITPIMGAIVAIFEKAWPIIAWIIESTWESIKRLIKGAIDIIMGVLKVFSGLFTGDWELMWEGIKQVLSGALNTIWSVLELWGVGKLLKFFKYIGKESGGIFKKLGQEIADAFRDMMKWVEDIWSKLPSYIKAPINAVIGLVNKMIGFLNNIKITIPPVSIPGIGKLFDGATLGLPAIPSIPMLETGTNYVPQDGPAYLHKGEAVVPKRYNPSAGGTGGGNVIQVILDGRVVQEYIDNGMGGRLGALGAV